ncbi:MAG: hypothetical protein ACLQDL_03125 [Spirochaetia bacterium]
MRKIVLLCLTVALLSSCIGIDSRLTIRDNGSGTLQLTYHISQLVADLGVSSTGKSAIPLPVSRSDFERSLASSNGRVRLTSFDRSEDAKDITIRAQLAFDSVDALAKVDAFRDADLKWGTEGGRHTFSQLVARTPRQPLSDDSKRMLDALFDGYDLSFVVVAPQPIQDSTLGELSADKLTLTYKTTIKDALTTTQDLVMSARW